MPLHLLGKKSWNVYNPENIARVRRDEAQAKVQEEEEERRMQEVDAERRILLLRGERPPTPPPPSQPSTSQAERERRTHYTGDPRKRRRRAGENDTDRDIRYAREDAELALAKRDELVHARKSKDDAPLHDSDGHINLFPEDGNRKRVEKNAEAEKEAAAKQRSYEDQYTMRFSNAAGFRQEVGKEPWYSSSHGSGITPESLPSKDVWGNEDPMRKERQKARMDLNDPLAVMKKGVRQLRSVEEERKKLNQERGRELEALKAAEQARSHHRKRRTRSNDSFEDFRLDDRPDKGRERGRRSDMHDGHSGDRPSSRSHRRRSSSRSRTHSHSHHQGNRRHRPHDRQGSRRRETGADLRHGS
ncbi:hypothetical protein BJX76DRAFT_291349 [Aspergillus varians]